MNHILASLLLAAAVPSPSPAGTPPTIVTVKSSPYCNALARHFNGAFVPMLANDRTLDKVDVELLDLNELFGKPDYQARFVSAREKLGRYVRSLQSSLPAIESEMHALRDGAALTSDQAAAKALTDAASDLERAYVKQRALTVDLQGMLQTMMEYDIDDLPHSLGGNSYAENHMPANAKDVKASLRFDGQRDVIAENEEKAVDAALNAATAFCSR